MVYRYKKRRYAKVKTSSGETGTVVKNSRVIISRIKDGGFYLTESVVCPFLYEDICFHNPCN